MGKQMEIFEGKFFNTNNTSPTQMKIEKAKALTQEQIVISVYKNNLVPLNASTVWRIAFEASGTPLTSVRRAITNLTDESYPGGPMLRKTDNMTTGIYGKREHYYELLPKNGRDIQDATI